MSKTTSCKRNRPFSTAPIRPLSINVNRLKIAYTYSEDTVFKHIPGHTPELVLLDANDNEIEVASFYNAILLLI